MENNPDFACNQSLQQQAFEALFDNGQLVCLQRSVDDPAPVFFPFPFAKPQYQQIATKQFVTLNPFKGGTIKRLKANISHRQSFTVEQDYISKKLQGRWFEKVLGEATVAVFSGNKSIHFHCRIAEEIDPATEAEVKELLCKAFPFVDYSVINDITKLCRTPGAIRNDRKAKDVEQTIFYVGQRFSLQDFIVRLRQATTGITKRLATDSTGYARGFFVCCQDGHYQTKEQVLTGYELAGKHIPSLPETLHELKTCGYPISKENLVLQALLEKPYVNEVLDDALKILETMPEKTAPKPILLDTATEIKSVSQKEKLGNAQENAMAAWIDTNLRKVDLLAVLEKYYSVKKITARSNSHHSFCCPFHDDKKPSGFISTNKNGIQMVHCKSDYCSISGHSQTAIGVEMLQGKNFKEAVISLFGYFPAFCRECGTEIKFENNKPVNLDGTPHQCKNYKPKQRKKQRQKEEMPIEVDLTRPRPQVTAIEKKTIEEALAQAMQSKSKSAAILAPTGGGKTTEAQKIILERLKVRKQTVYSTKDKATLFDFWEILKQKVPSEDKKFLQIISHDTSSKIADDTLVVLTHQTYNTRKGFSPYHFSAMLWMEGKDPDGNKRNPLVILDEIQAYCENQRKTFSRGGKYTERRFKDHDKARKELLQQCPMFSGRGNCSMCRQSTKNYLYPTSTGILELKTWIDGKTGTDAKPVELPTEQISQQAQHNTMFVEEIKQEQIGGLRFYHSKQLPDSPVTLESVWKDFMRFAYKPKRYIARPIEKESKKPVDWQELKREFEIAEYETNSQAEQNRMKAEIRKKYIPPSLPCEVENYEFMDTTSLRFIEKHAEKVIMLGATLRPDQQEFLAFCCPGMETYRVTESKQKLDELAIIVYRKKFDYVKTTKQGKEVTLKPILDALDDGKKILAFTPKKEHAKQIYQEFPRDYPVAILNGEDTTIDQKHSDYRIGLTWEFGPLGAGVNRPKDFVALADAAVYLPRIAYGHDGKITEQSIQDGYRWKAEDTLEQCGGRILRRDKDGLQRKVIILHNVAEINPDVARVAKNWQAMVKTPIKILTVNDSQEYLLENVVTYLEEGKFLQTTEEEYTKAGLAGKKLHEITPAKRELVRIPKEAKEQKRREEVERLAKDGFSWREVVRKLNLHRYPNQFRAYYEIYTKNNKS